MNKVSLVDRLRYRFDNLMSRGTIALVGVLFAVTAALVLAVTLVLVLARVRPAGDAPALGPGEALWQTVMRTIDAGTVAGDTGWCSKGVNSQGALPGPQSLHPQYTVLGLLLHAQMRYTLFSV